MALFAALTLLLGCGGTPVPERAVTAEADAGEVRGGVPALHPAIDHLDETVVTLTTTDGADVEVAAKVAATTAERQRGLMEVEELPAGVGMLFLFDGERDGGFWMWNTLIELDIAFAAADGTIHTVATMTPCNSDDPADCPSTVPDGAYTSALEVPGGWLDEVGVTAGATLTWTEPVAPG